MFGEDGGLKDELWEYDPAFNFWFSKAPIPGGTAAGRRESVAFAIGSKGYAGTGKTLSGKKRDFWEYSPSIPLGIDENYENAISTVFPNPMTDNSTVILSEEIFNKNENMFWELISVDGKLIHSEKISSSSFTISRDGIASGIYFLTIKTPETILGNKKISIQ